MTHKESIIQALRSTPADHPDYEEIQERAEKMEQMHTPGPWRLCAGGVNVYADSNYGSLSICRAIPANVGSGNAPFDQRAANARLIAAAPELLEALKAMVGEVDSGARVRTAVVDQARAAIAKATR